jgi:hypothetical protein
MPRGFLLSVIFMLSAALAYGQKPITVEKDSTGKASARIDTVPSTYVNVGKIAARKSMIRSAIIPGWGQISNGISVYRVAKVAAIYTGATFLGISFIQNSNDYKYTLTELQAREINGVPTPGNIYINASDAQLTQAKETFRRNKQVVIFSFVALYGVNVIEAYIDARLKYFDIDNELTMKISPGFLPSGNRYGYNALAPAIKFSFRL